MLPLPEAFFVWAAGIFVYMPVERVAIDAFLQAAATAVLLDVRSPGEYEHAHIPGAVSLPLFTNEERAVVGTAYKQESREKAIKIGLDFFGPKMRRMVEEVESLVADRWPLAESDTINKQQLTNNVCIYCWRGGMRSGAVSWLLGLYGFNVMTLQGGYKQYRAWVFEKVAYPYHLKLIGGYTGSGKTALLHELERQGELVIDLEALASHKGSAFGSIGMPPSPTQEAFENKLAQQLHTKTHINNDPNFFKSPCSIWIEDESQRIGSLNIPNLFWQTMRKAPIYFLDVPFEQRLRYLVAEYGHLNLLQLTEATRRIAKRLGPLETKNAIQFLEEGSVLESFRILLTYYDKQYRKALHNRQNLTNLLHTIPCTAVGAGNASLLLKPVAS